MKKLIRKIILLIIICMIVIFMSGKVNAAEENKLKIKIDTDASEAMETKRIYAYISLIEFNNVELNEPMAIGGTLNYDENIFESVEFEGLNNWNAEYNPESKKILLDSSKIKENDNILKITFNIKDVSKSFVTDIKLTDIELSNNVDVDMTGLNLNARVSVTINDENDNSQEPNNPEDDNNQDENAGNNDNNNESDNEQNSSEDVNNDNNENDNNNGENNQNNNQNGNVNNNNNNNQNGEQNNNKEPDKIEKVEDLTTSKDPLPQTGVNYTIVGVIISVFILGVLAFIGFKRLEK